MTQYVADDHWSEADPNPNAAYPRLDYRYNANNTQTSSFWIKNGSYLRLKERRTGFHVQKPARLSGRHRICSSFRPSNTGTPKWEAATAKYPLQRAW